MTDYVVIMSLSQNASAFSKLLKTFTFTILLAKAEIQLKRKNKFKHRN